MSGELTIYPQNLKTALEEYQSMCSLLRQAAEKITAVEQELNFLSDPEISEALRSLQENLTCHTGMLLLFETILQSCLTEYSDTEQQLLETGDALAANTFIAKREPAANGESVLAPGMSASPRTTAAALYDSALEGFLQEELSYDSSLYASSFRMPFEAFDNNGASGDAASAYDNSEGFPYSSDSGTGASDGNAFSGGSGSGGSGSSGGSGASDTGTSDASGGNASDKGSFDGSGASAFPEADAPEKAHTSADWSKLSAVPITGKTENTLDTPGTKAVSARTAERAAVKPEALSQNIEADPEPFSGLSSDVTGASILATAALGTAGVIGAGLKHKSKTRT